MPENSLLNILLVSQEYPPETNWGGIATYMQSLANGLKNNGHNVVVLSRAIGKDTFCMNQGIMVYRILPKFRIDGIPFFWRLNGYWTGYRFSVAIAIRKIVKKHKIDIIECPEIRAEALIYTYMSIIRPPIVVKMHSPQQLVDQLSRVPRQFCKKSEYWKEKLMVTRANALTSCSKALIDKCKKILPIEKRKIRVIYNPIRPTFTSKDFPKKKNSYPTVLYIGRIERRKGVHLLIKAIPQIVDQFFKTRFIFVGADSPGLNSNSLTKEIIEVLNPKYRDHVIFKGAVGQEKIPQYLADATLCVLPSLWENFPFSCLESMAAGKAVVGSRHGGMSEMIDDGINGFIVDPTNTEELVKKIVIYLESEKKREEHGKAAQEKVFRVFNPDTIIENTVSIYRRTIANKKKQYGSSLFRSYLHL